jgi:hypothetical protein
MPENFWISKNIDFTQWESADPPQVLLLCAPLGHGTTEVCSHIIDQEKASGANGPVLYFFSSSARKARSTSLTHTLLHQIVYCSSAGKANSIAAAFLSVLVSGHFQRHSPDFRKDDPLDTIIKNILDVPDVELIAALAGALQQAGIRKLSIIVDGLWEHVIDCFIEFIMEAVPEITALLTCRHSSFQNMSDRVVCVEYDMERKGLYVPTLTSR